MTELPDKDLYGIEECAKEWKCTPDDILEYFRMGRIVPAFPITGRIDVSAWQEDSEQDEHADLSTGEDKLPEEEIGYAPDGWSRNGAQEEGRSPSSSESSSRHRHPGPQFVDGGKIDCSGLSFVGRTSIGPGWMYLPYFQKSPQYVDENGRHCVRLEDLILYRSRSSGKLRLPERWYFPIVEPGTGAWIPVMDLKISSEERSQFNALRTAQSTPINARERESLLRTIAILARLLVLSVKEEVRTDLRRQVPASVREKNFPLGTIEKPNQSAIAALIREHISKFGLAEAGLSQAALRQRLSEGIEAISETKN